MWYAAPHPVNKTGPGLSPGLAKLRSGVSFELGMISGAVSAMIRVPRALWDSQWLIAGSQLNTRIEPKPESPPIGTGPKPRMRAAKAVPGGDSLVTSQR